MLVSSETCSWVSHQTVYVKSFEVSTVPEELRTRATESINGSVLSSYTEVFRLNSPFPVLQNIINATNDIIQFFFPIIIKYSSTMQISLAIRYSLPWEIMQIKEDKYSH